MQRLQRFIRRISRRVDAFIVQVENHEALVGSAIDELERALHQGRADVARVGRAGERLRATVVEERAAALRWRERAKRESSEARGVECLRRSKHSMARAVSVSGFLVEHEIVEQRLHAHTARLEQRLLEIVAQRDDLRLREARSDGLSVSSESARDGDVESLLERWEARLIRDEATSGYALLALNGLEDVGSDATEAASLILEFRALKEET